MTAAAADQRRAGGWPDRAAGWLRDSRAGLFLVAVLVGVGSGLGAVVFRYLIYFFTWLATGHGQFGQGGYVGSSHLPWLGLAFFLFIPMIGGIVYGPLIYRYAREARGHGVPEVMAAVAENGGRIRPQVSIVKALASALCIGTGGSVGREGPIVQIGSALASSLGQWVKMPDDRMRILVACGAGGGIAATFNAPLTGVFFGVEIILREFSLDAIFTVMLAAMIADAVAIPFLGDKPFLTGFPSGISLPHPSDYLLVAVLAVLAGLIGLLFKTVLYATEDLWDRVWQGRPEWARPAIGGFALGLILLALPQMYGVGYPVMYKAVAGNYAIWFLLVLAAGKIVACSTTLGMGGSGGVFAPSLFVGATSGMAFGAIVSHIFGPAAGSPALYAVVAMGAVFTSAARAPLTSVASVVEMTGDYTLTLPVMLAVAIAAATSRGLSYGTIYTTKLLRRGQDIDRTAPWRAFGDLKATDAMRRFRIPLILPDGHGRGSDTPAGAGVSGSAPASAPAASPSSASPSSASPSSASPSSASPSSASPSSASTAPAVALQLAGLVVHQRDPQVVHGSESMTQTLSQLSADGCAGLPVLSADGREVEGWISDASVLQTVAAALGGTRAPSAHPASATSSGRTGSGEPAEPLPGYRLLEITVGAASPAVGMQLGSLSWPPGSMAVSVLHGQARRDPDPELILGPDDRIWVLVPAGQARGSPEVPAEPTVSPGT